MDDNKDDDDLREAEALAAQLEDQIEAEGLAGDLIDDPCREVEVTPGMRARIRDWYRASKVWLGDLRNEAPRQISDEALDIERGSLQDLVGSPYQNDAELILYAMANFPHLVSLIECSTICLSSRRGGGNDPGARASLTLEVTDAIVRSVTGPRRSAVCEVFLIVLDQGIHDSADEVQKIPQPLESKAYRSEVEQSS